MANTKVTGDLIASLTIATGNIADNAVTSTKISGITTAHITEGSNLYYTNARTDARVNLQTGANLSLSNKSTSDLSEGTNLYYTDARADARAALLVDSAPSTLDTLNELAAALGDDPNFATTTANSIGLKAPLASPSFTGNSTFGGPIYLLNTSARISAGGSGEVGFNYNTGATGSLVWYGGGTASKFNVTSTGNVGIGKSPTDKTLELYSTGNTALRIQNNTTGSGSNDGLLIETSISNGDALIWNYESAALRFGTAGTERMRIDSSGRTHIIGPALTLTSETTYGLSVSSQTDATKVVVIGYDNSADVGVIQAVDIAVAWKNLSLCPTSGNVGIGTNSIEQKLHVEGRGIFDGGGSSDILQIRNDNGGGVFGMTSNLFALDLASTSNFRIRQGSSVPFYLNSSGDVGIGTTPQAAGATWRTLFVGASATIVSRQAASGYDSIFANNYYVNSSNQDRVRTTGPSSRMFLDGNNIRFQISPTNSTAPSWSEIMRVDDSGNVGIGETSPDAKLEVVYGGGYNVGMKVRSTSGYAVMTLEAPANNYPILEFKEAGTQKWQVFNEPANDSLNFYAWGAGPGIRLNISQSGYVGIGNTSGVGARTKLGVSFNVGGSAANLAESVTYATMEMYPYRSDSTYGMFFGNKGNAAGYIQTANGAGNDKGDIHINPFGGSVGIGVGNTSAGALLDVVAPNSGGATRQDMFRLLQSGQNTLSCYMYGGATDLVQLHVSGAEQHLSLTTGGVATATTATGIHLRSGGDVGIGTITPRAKLEVASDITIQNGVYTYQATGTAVGSDTLNFDITVNNEGGGGNVFKIEAGFSHYYAIAHASIGEWWSTTRGTAIVNTYILNAGSTNAGTWSASKPTTSILRITKSAGTYGGGGKYWVKVTYRPY